METINEYQERRLQEMVESLNKSKLTGIACPNCLDVELLRTQPHVVLTSCPPQMEIKCLKCSYHTTVYI